MQRRKYRDPRLFDRGGRFIWARVRDEHGLIQRLSTRCTSEAAASAWADEYERKAADPSYRRAAEATLGSAIADWLAELRRRKVSAATYSIAETKAGHFVRLWGVDWPLLRIENDLVLRYIDTREREPGAKRGETVAPLTVKKELGALKGILEWARFRGTFPRDLATVLPPRYSGQHKPRTRFLTHAEAVALLRQLEPRRGAQVAFIIATGARRGESFRARRSDAHLDAGNPHVEIRGTKTAKAKGTVPITGLSHPFLIYALQHAPGKDVLFDPWGKMVRDLAAACARAGIEPVSANDLRRTCGKWHRLAGATAEQVSIILRHSTDTLAQTTYGQISGADIGPALRLFAPIQPVSDLYAATAPTEPSNPIQSEDPMGISASPAGLGPATPGLGNQDTQGASDLGKTSAESTSGARPSVRNVRVLNVDSRAVYTDEELSDLAAVFPFAGPVPS
jgi:integrase